MTFLKVVWGMVEGWTDWHPLGRQDLALSWGLSLLISPTGAL